MSDESPKTHHEEEILGKAYDSRLMRRLLAIPASVQAAESSAV